MRPIKQTLPMIALLVGACSTEHSGTAGDTTIASTTAESSSGVVETPVRVDDSDTATPALNASDSSGLATSPADVVRRYYREIQARDFNAAYAEWSHASQNGQTKSVFAAGFADTRQVRATVSDSVRTEGA